MAINTTRWTPDTCSNPPCIIEYTWDSSLPLASRVLTPSTIIQQCSLHAGMALAAHWTALQDENHRKNKLLDRAQTQFGLTAAQLATITWFYDASRVLHVNAVPLTAAQKTAAQTWADTNLGVGKVIIT